MAFQTTGAKKKNERFNELGQVGSHLEKYKRRSILHTIHKNKVQKHKGSEYKILNYTSTRRLVMLGTCRKTLIGIDMERL